MKSIIEFIKESKEELKKVQWPSKDQVIRYTMVVIVTSIALAISLGVLDMGFSRFIESFLF